MPYHSISLQQHGFLVGVHRIPYFRIRPDPDPAGSGIQIQPGPLLRILPDPLLSDPAGSGSCRVHYSGSCRIHYCWIRILTGSRDFGSGRIWIFTGSGSNLIRIKAELQPVRISKHRIIKDKKILQFVVMLHHEFLTYLQILHFPDSKYQAFFNILGCHVLCLLTLLIVLIF